jgi:small ubiquitin-related modifier
MEKIFSAYAQRKGVPPNALRFLLDGTRISGDQTPKMVRAPPLPYLLVCGGSRLTGDGVRCDVMQQLELEDQDQIDCALEQVGGSACV